MSLCWRGRKAQRKGNSRIRFLEWLNGRGKNKKEQEKVSKIKYLIITGDNVNGCGVYPSQFGELNIKDIYQQYKEFSRFISQVPEYIEVFIIPGQHDAVRWADPQPAIPKEFAPELHALLNVHFLGSPSWLSIEGMLTVQGARHYYADKEDRLWNVHNTDNLWKMLRDRKNNKERLQDLQGKRKGKSEKADKGENPCRN